MALDWNIAPQEWFEAALDTSAQGQVHTPKPRFARMPIKLLHDPNITDGAKVLYTHMIWRFGRNGKNFEGRASMAKFLGVNETTISRRLKELEAVGWIIVVERLRKAENGNYQTPFYHVFLNLKDSAKFRGQYQPQEGETLRPKPAIKERKSRKGIGGKPKHKPNLEPADTQVHGVYSSTHHAVNSSTHYLDALDLDALNKITEPPPVEETPHGEEIPIKAFGVYMNLISPSISEPQRNQLKLLIEEYGDDRVCEVIEKVRKRKRTGYIGVPYIKAALANEAGSANRRAQAETPTGNLIYTSIFKLASIDDASDSLVGSIVNLVEIAERAAKDRAYDAVKQMLERCIRDGITPPKDPIAFEARVLSAVQPDTSTASSSALAGLRIVSAGDKAS